MSSSDDLLFKFHFDTFSMSVDRLKQSVKLIGTKLSPAIDIPARYLHNHASGSDPVGIL